MNRLGYSQYMIKSKTSGNSKVICSKCNKMKRIKFMVIYKGRLLCSNCKPNKINCGKRKMKENEN